MFTFSSSKRVSGLVLCAAMLCGGPALGAEAPDRLKVGQYHVEMATGGAGPYTVIFESGFASPMAVWQKIAPEIGKTSKVLMYSRAGTGKSDPRPEPRTPANISLEFEHMIEAAQLKPPFILVGHSYGGYLIRLYAARHPDKVAGLVFVDASVERMDSELKKIDAVRVAQDQAKLAAMMPPRLQAELKLVDEAFAAASLQGAPALPDVPAVVLTSTRVEPKAEFLGETAAGKNLWRTLHEQLFRQFAHGSHVVTSISGHNIHREEPELVIAAIQQVMAGATAQAKRRTHQQARARVLLGFDKAGELLKSKRHAEAGQLIAAELKASQFGEGEINQMGYETLGERKQPELAALVMQYNAAAFPDSANAHDSYGEILLRTNQPKQAKAAFEKAIALATASGKNPRTLDGYKANLAKAEKAIAQ